MQDLIRRTLEVLRDKQVLRRLGVLVSLTVIAIACYILFHLLRTIDVDKVIDALGRGDMHSIGLAALFVAASYFTLTFYDLFALRTIGHPEVPYRVSALAAFTSYSVGHNVGASAFTGGAVRYRIYSSCGLSAVDVTKICFVAGLTFWLGNAAVLGMGIAYHPEAASAVDQLPPWLNRIVAFAILLSLGGYVAWVSLAPRIVGRGPWAVLLPGGGLTLLQIAIGIVDLGFVVVAVIFVSATLLGFASHSPGGLGVFDAAMLVGLWQMDKEELLAGMLLFRLLYYIVPFVISVILLTLRELILGSRFKRACQGTAAGDAASGLGMPRSGKYGDTGA
jgi:uncharacterized membrane protein YbhN (UPF0104 family)